MLQAVKPKQGEVFWDLGCGSGRPMMVASLIYPFLKECNGVELLPDLAKLAEEACARLEASCTEDDIEYSKINVIEGDILKVDWWTNGDIIYGATLLFPDELLSAIADKAELMKPGSRFISLKELPERPKLKLLA